MCEENSSADAKVSGGGGVGTPGTGAENLLKPVVNLMVRQAVPLQPMNVDGGADYPPAAHGGGCAQRSLGPHGESGLEHAPGRTSKPVSSLFS